MTSLVINQLPNSRLKNPNLQKPKQSFPITQKASMKNYKNRPQILEVLEI